MPDGVVLIRHGNNADAVAIARLIVDAFTRDAAKVAPPPAALRETPESIAARLDVEHAAVAELDGVPVGCVIYERRAGDIYLARLSVAATHQRRGIAQQLIEFVAAEARALGAPALSAKVRIQLIDNQRLFARCGFHEVARHAHPGFSEPTSIELRKPLAPAPDRGT